MLSKCFNPRCSATFQYLGRGRLFRIDFGEEGRKNALAGKEAATLKRSGAQLVEHFWLCDDCAGSLSLELTSSGQVDLVLLDTSVQKRTIAAPKTHNQRGATAS